MNWNSKLTTSCHNKSAAACIVYSNNSEVDLEVGLSFYANLQVDYVEYLPATPDIMYVHVN